MLYKTNDFFLQLPSEKIADTSTNIITLSDIGATIVISRDFLKKDQTIEDYAEGQFKKLKKDMKNLSLSDAKPTKFGEEHTGVEYFCSFMANGRNIYQVLLIVNVDTKVFAMTYSQLKPFTEHDLLQLEEMKKSFVITIE